MTYTPGPWRRGKAVIAQAGVLLNFGCKKARKFKGVRRRPEACLPYNCRTADEAMRGHEINN
jgi:hypothetical protein